MYQPALFFSVLGKLTVDQGPYERAKWSGVVSAAVTPAKGSIRAYHHIPIPNASDTYKWAFRVIGILPGPHQQPLRRHWLF